MSLYLVRLHAAVDFRLFRGDSARKCSAQHKAEALGSKGSVTNMIGFMTSDMKAHR